MEGLEEKLGTILSNPQMMSQIMSLASSLNPPRQENAAPPQTQPLPDFELLQKLSGLADKTGINADQQALLQALTPYLSCDRISRLERAMRAAKTARLASTLLGSNGLNLLSGR